MVSKYSVELLFSIPIIVFGIVFYFYNKSKDNHYKMKYKKQVDTIKSKAYKVSYRLSDITDKMKTHEIIEKKDYSGKLGLQRAIDEHMGFVREKIEYYTNVDFSFRYNDVVIKIQKKISIRQR